MRVIATIRLMGGLAGVVAAGLLWPWSTAHAQPTTETTPTPAVGNGAGQHWWPADTPRPSSQGQGASLGVLIAVIAVVALALAVAVFLVVRHRRSRAHRQYAPTSAYVAPAHQTGSAPTASLPQIGGDVQQIEAEREALASALIHLADTLGADPARLSQIQTGLARAGYQIVDPTGTRFDNRRHEALQTRPTNDPALDMTVAATARVGYRRDDRIVRQPEVVIYRYEPARGAPR